MLIGPKTLIPIHLSEIKRERESELQYKLMTDAKSHYSKNSYDLAYPLFKQLDEQYNDATAQFILGAMHFYGQCAIPDHQIALDYFTKAKDNGNQSGWRGMGHVYSSGHGNVPQDYIQAMHCYTQSTSSKNPKDHGWDDIGDLYQKGYGVPKDYSEAMRCYEKSHSSRGLTNVGKMYQYGLGVTQDFQKAWSYYQKVMGESSEAWIDIGILHLFGLGTSKNSFQATHYFERAAYGQHQFAEYAQHKAEVCDSQPQHQAAGYEHLAVCYHYGLNKSKSESKAISCFQEAAKLKGSKTVMNMEEFQKKHKTEAENFLKNKEYAAALIHLLFLELDKDPEVQFQLGMLYSGVEGITQSDANTVKYLTRAHEGGHPEAAFRLGESYMSRSIFRKDPVEARIWYRKTPCNLSGEISFKVATVLIDNNNKKDGKTILAHLRNAIEKEHPQAQQLHDTWTASQKPFEWNSLFSFGNEAPESNPKVIN